KIKKFVRDKGKTPVEEVTLTKKKTDLHFVDEGESQDGGTAPQKPVPVPPPMTEPKSTKQQGGHEESEEETNFHERLKELLPDVLVAQKTKESKSWELKKAVSEAEVHCRKKEFEKAHELLDKVEDLLDQEDPEAQLRAFKTREKELLTLAIRVPKE